MKENAASAEIKMREPKFHVSKRTLLTKRYVLGVRLLSVLLALFFCGILTYFMTGLNPIKVYLSMIDGAVGSERRIWSWLQNAAVLLIIAVALTPAFMMRFWNIGAEGQALMGGLAAAMCMMFLGKGNVPDYILMLIMILCSVAAGAIWALIPAIFKAKWNTNETLFTLMMNYIATQIVAFYVIKFANPAGSGHIGVINGTSKMGWFPQIFGSEYLMNIIIVVAFTLIIYVYLKFTKKGFEIAVVGESENTARYLGINIKKVIMRTMVVSGALCGLAGLILVAGTNHTIATNTVGGRGFTGIMVSWLAKFNPIYMIIVSLFIVFLERGCIEISTVYGLSESYSEIITGIILFFIIGSEFFIKYSINRVHKTRKEA